MRTRPRIQKIIEREYYIVGFELLERILLAEENLEEAQSKLKAAQPNLEEAQANLQEAKTHLQEAEKLSETDLSLIHISEPTRPY